MRGCGGGTAALGRRLDVGVMDGGEGGAQVSALSSGRWGAVAGDGSLQKGGSLCPAELEVPGGVLQVECS